MRRKFIKFFNLALIVMVVQVDIAFFTNSNKESKSKGVLRNNPIAAVFTVTDPLVRSSTPTAVPCRWLRQSRRQYQQCRNEVALQGVLNDSRFLTVTHCEDQFRYDRWNCSHERTLFRKVHRETAFMYALAAAGLTTTVARSCAEGKLRKCQCGSTKPQDSTKPGVNSVRKNWRWGGCGDNLQYGRRFTRKFLDLRTPNADFQQSILRHNCEVGIRTVASQMREVCKCHGVSGSCTVKTCWKRVAPFAAVATLLKKKYHRAVKFDFGNRATKRAEPQNRKWPKRQLLYLEQSPTFCLTTSNRVCLNKDNCATLCCGRGYTTREYFENRNCKCRWRKNFEMICDQCPYEMVEHKCK